MEQCALYTMYRYSLTLLLLTVASVPSAAQNAFDAWYIDSAFFAVGAIQPVPCNDGTFVGGALYCNRSSDNANLTLRQPCADICINRSYDGGVTWVRERVDAPYHSSGTIVRMRDGVLLTADASMYHGFLRSTDHGRSWHRHITVPDRTDWYGDPLSWETHGDRLARDDRGTLFWRGSASSHYDSFPLSIDEGETASWLHADTTNPGGSSTTFLYNSTGVLSGVFGSTADYGRTFIWHRSVHYHLPKESYAAIDGFRFSGVVFRYAHRDTVVLIVTRALLADQERDGVYAAALYATEGMPQFRLDSSRIWREWVNGPTGEQSCVNLDLGFPEYPIFDSLGRMQYPGFTSYWSLGDSCQRWTYRFADGTLDTTVFPDTTVWKRPWETPATAFYDLDGNLHSNSRNSFQHADHVRPVSILDKLHTCGGMQFLIGGGAINGVTIAEQFTRNASITWTVTPNKRMVFIDIKAVDTSKAVYVCFTVGDSLRPGMTYCDSTNIPTPAPTFKVGRPWESGHFGFLYPVYVDPYDGWIAHDYVGREPWRTTLSNFKINRQPPRETFVRSRDRNGCIRCSDTVSLGVVSVDEQSDYGSRDTSLTLALAPNPASGEVTMEFSTGRLGGAPYRIEVVNMLGTVVYSDESTMVGGVTNVATFSVAALPRGAYVVRIVARGSVASQVLLVQ